MDAFELLKGWPGWSNAGAETILASPAWRMPVRFGDGKGVLTLVAEARLFGQNEEVEAPGGRSGRTTSTDVNLTVTFDGVPCALSLFDSEAYPDLHRLWAKLGALPDEIVLALVEKECGSVFTMLEEATRRQFGVKGLAKEVAPSARVFELVGGGVALRFALTLPADLLPVFGRLEHLDPKHETIRSLTRSVWADYETLMLTDEELEVMKAGDFLLRPAGSGATARWVTDNPDDDAIHVLSAEPVVATFAQFADDGLPLVPPLAQGRLVRNGRVLADVAPDTVGLAPALKLITYHP